MNISRNYKYYILASLAVILIGVILSLTRGFNLGQDFTGGTVMQFELGKEVPSSEVKDLISEFKLNETIIAAGDKDTQIIIKTPVSLDNAQRNQVFTKLSEKYSLTDDDFLSADQFGPSVGKEIQKKALYSILIASVAMLIYIAFRFQVVYGITAIIALVHDVLILVSIYLIFNIPITSTFIAAVLTIVGYSINDTIVVFDRVRENVRLMKKASHFEIADESIKQTLWRSINTSLTTVLGILALYVLGVEAIKDFAFPLIMGISVGTFSSIFIASPIWAAIMEYRRHKKNTAHLVK